ncbi:metallophosphoesterase [Gloeothece citriformis PCC 7424]|uniref:Metallophosphoesterase n=1 Tax=Gloeothece citriformis (strain PCC 7424) TaxID=65393 RepID=B7KLF6_GLOC7|nr:metallophosphoesterase [Gloeothece citriformis]ACK72528.1 metallophosphoesterase [Gloeothece citriformis PCC 7424]
MNFRFAVISDPHIAISQTIRNIPNRFHLVEVSIPALELVLKHIEQLDLDFLLLPGDLTQDGEPENHHWLRQRLEALPFPVYVVPGNHDVPTPFPTASSIGLKDFPNYYSPFGYYNPQQLYYTCEVLPGIQLIGLNSNLFDGEGKQLGCLDEEQLIWLEKTLSEVKEQFVIVMIHHNVIEHLPGQSDHVLGRRYMLDNAPMVLQLLEKYGVKLIFTGHLHIQDIAYHQGIYEITTGSLVSYPHPYRIIDINYQRQKQQEVKVKSYRVNSVPGWENLPEMSRQWLSDRSYPFMMKLLTTPPLNLSVEEADPLTPKLRNFWADMAAGDGLFDFPEFPPLVRRYFHQFSAVNREGKPHLIDNQTTLVI